MSNMDRSEVKDQWDKVSETYAESRDSDGPETELIKDMLKQYSQKPRVLDVGCGDGMRTLRYLPESSVGMDISRNGLELASDNLSNELAQSDMVSMPFKDDSFDAITAYFAVFHVERGKHSQVYEEFARVTNSNGKVLMTLSSGNFETVRRGWMGGKMLFSSPGRNQTLRMLENAGFTEHETKTSNDPLGSSTEFVLAQKE